MTTLDEAMTLIAELRERVDYLETSSGLFASDRDLDSAKGDPAVKFEPRGYTGPDCRGRRFSECPPDFLLRLASALSWSADHPKEGKEQYAKFDRLDAARARGWARRNAARGTGSSSVGEFPGDPAPPSGSPPAFRPPPATAPPRLGGYQGSSYQAPPTPPANDDDIPF